MKHGVDGVFNILN